MLELKKLILEYIKILKETNQLYVSEKQIENWYLKLAQKKTVEYVVNKLKTKIEKNNSPS